MKDLASISVRRPALALVMAMIIVIIGALAAWDLGVRELPGVEPAQVTVTTQYGGADAEVVENQLTEPLEAEVNSVEGIDAIDSVSRRGRSTINIEFDRDVEMERAANDVRDAASGARNQLPSDADPPNIQKADAEGRPIIWIRLTSDERNVLELTEIADNRVKDRLETIRGSRRSRCGETTPTRCASG